MTSSRYFVQETGRNTIYKGCVFDFLRDKNNNVLGNRKDI